MPPPKRARRASSEVEESDADPVTDPSSHDLVESEETAWLGYSVESKWALSRVDPDPVRMAPVIWAASLEAVKGKAAHRSVMIAIANRFNRKRHCAWPSRQTISRDSGAGLTTVDQAITLYERLGILRVYPTLKHNGARGQNLYGFPRFDAAPPVPPSNLRLAPFELPPRGAPRLPGRGVGSVPHEPCGEGA